MDTFFLLGSNIFPLYILIGLGYIAGRWMDVDLKSMANVAIFILAPMVTLGAMMQLKFDPDYVTLPLMVFIAATCIGVTTYKLARHHWKNSTANMVAMSSVTGNTGYFGFPIVMALFQPDYAGVYLLMNVGIVLSESCLGYYFGARGHADTKQALLKVAKLPVLHALWIGVTLNLCDVTPPSLLLRYTTYATGGWVMIGMMLVGIALGRQQKITLDFRLIRWLFVTKFLAWPLFATLFILLDSLWLHTFDSNIYQMLVIFSCVPLAGNMVAFSATLNLHPERVAGAVLLSTFLALFTIPAGLALYHHYENIFLIR